MITQPNIASIYDFERIFETAFAAVMASYSLTAATPDTIASFQEKRPRVEIVVKAGQAIDRGNGGAMKFLQNYSDASFPPITLLAHAAYSGTAAFTVVTNSKESDKAMHAQYRSAIRFLLDTIQPRINGAGTPGGLVNHCLQFTRPTNTSLIFADKEGFWRSSLEYEIQFSIQDNAWAALNPS